jgi:hypothetical protein
MLAYTRVKIFVLFTEFLFCVRNSNLPTAVRLLYSCMSDPLWVTIIGFLDIYLFTFHAKLKTRRSRQQGPISLSSNGKTYAPASCKQVRDQFMRHLEIMFYPCLLRDFHRVTFRGPNKPEERAFVALFGFSYFFVFYKLILPLSGHDSHTAGRIL